MQAEFDVGIGAAPSQLKFFALAVAGWLGLLDMFGLNTVESGIG